MVMDMSMADIKLMAILSLIQKTFLLKCNKILKITTNNVENLCMKIDSPFKQVLIIRKEMSMEHFVCCNELCNGGLSTTEESPEIEIKRTRTSPFVKLFLHLF